MKGRAPNQNLASDSGLPTRSIQVGSGNPDSVMLTPAHRAPGFPRPTPGT